MKETRTHTVEEAFTEICETLDVTQGAITSAYNAKFNAPRKLIAYALFKLYDCCHVRNGRITPNLVEIGFVMDRDQRTISRWIESFKVSLECNGAAQRTWQELKMVAYGESSKFKEHKNLELLAA